MASDSVAIGKKISFIPNVLNANVITGTVIGQSTYALASKLGDLRTTHAAVKMNVPNINDVEYLNFFTVADENNRLHVYAEEWITPGSIKEISAVDHVDIRVHGVSAAGIADLRAYLQTGGYNISVLSSEKENTSVCDGGAP